MSASAGRARRISPRASPFEPFPRPIHRNAHGSGVIGACPLCAVRARPPATACSSWRGWFRPPNRNSCRAHLRHRRAPGKPQLANSIPSAAAKAARRPPGLPDPVRAAFETIQPLARRGGMFGRQVHDRHVEFALKDFHAPDDFGFADPPAIDPSVSARVTINPSAGVCVGRGFQVRTGPAVTGDTRIQLAVKDRERGNGVAPIRATQSSQFVLPAYR
jgi:hypothetical protein